MKVPCIGELVLDDSQITIPSMNLLLSVDLIDGLLVSITVLEGLLRLSG